MALSAETRTRPRADDALLGLGLRAPPANLEAEQALLGALLANNKAYERVSEFLAAEHFADPVHGRIYAAIVRRIERGQLANAVTLKADLEAADALEEVGGTPYLAQLVSAMIGIVNAAEYGRVVHDCWLRRQLVDIGEEVVNRAFGDAEGLDAPGQVEAAEQALFDLAAKGPSEGGFVTFEKALAQAIEVAERAYQSGGGVSGLETGLKAVDKRLGGLHPSDLIILAGRPGMGKSALATCLAFGAAKALAEAARATGAAKPSGTVALFSLEMSSEQLATRLLAEQSRISGDRIRRGVLDERDFQRFVEVSRALASYPIYIDDTPALTISGLRTRCRRLKRTHGLSLIIIDYLQLLRPAAGTRPENRVLEISQITQSLKAIAKELSVPVLALSQLSRAVEGREDKRPLLSDLRESGTIEQDADVVMFLYRDEYYLSQRQPKQMAFDSEDKYQTALDKWQREMEKVHNIAELIIAKQRHGPTGKEDLFFEGEFTRFADLDREHGAHDAD
jgi:replicative DNA helicase